MPDTSQPIVVVPDDIGGAFRSAPNIERIRAIASLEIHGARPAGEAELGERIRDATAVLSFRPAFTRFPKPVLDRAPGLKLVCISGTGVEDVDVAHASARGIAVANVPGPSNRAVAEHCLALLFAVARAVPAQDRAIRRGEWKAIQGIELGGKTLGIVGVSGISCELAPLARGLGMKVISWSRNNEPARAAAIGAEAVGFDQLLAAADIVSLHVRLNDATRNLIGTDELARMKRGAILINTARGGVVDEAALIAALKGGRIAGAGLDVFAQEPLPADHPFLAMENVVMTPVSAWSTVDASARMINQSIENVVGFLRGAPVNVVNSGVLST
ncbi:MAG TPA: NAD(P)-dependent oxidoreductase [Xanthobacteraceae bacterium]|nr:NAD(P)-dependent oxidoreductase [Xanthobacteraceae bacterium]